MAVKSRAVSVATTATRLDTADETTGSLGSSIAVYNNGSATIYIGGATVTTAAGTPVPAGTWGPSMDLEARADIGGAGTDDHEGLYGIVASGTVEARVLGGERLGGEPRRSWSHRYSGCRDQPRHGHRLPTEIRMRLAGTGRSSARG